MTGSQPSPPRGSLTFAAACLTVSLAPIAFGVVWGVPEVHRVEPATTEHEIGSNYIAALRPSRFAPLLSTDGDTLEKASRSTLALFEDGRELGPPHTQHAWIREYGGGLFSHWGSSLYFSSSDNSDPRTNGRLYTVRTSARLPFLAAWLWAACFVGAALRAVRASTKRGQDVTPHRAGWRWASLVAAVVLYGTVAQAISGERESVGIPLLLLIAVCLFASLALAWYGGRELALSRLPSIAPARRRVAMWSVAIGRPLERHGAAGTVLRVAAAAVPYVAFAAVLVIPWPDSVLVGSYYFITPVVLPLGLLIYGCHARRDYLGLVTSLAITMILFALPLAALWQDSVVHYNAVGGLLPFSDASGYYYDARRLHDGHLFGWSARRPLFPGLLAALLASSGGNLQFSLAVLTALNGTAVFVLAREVLRWRGPFAATAVTAVCFLFYRVEGGTGTALTENLGFAMGVIAFAALLKGARIVRLWPAALGLAFLTVALMARAGAFFVLPAIVLAVTWIFRRDRHWLQVATALTAAVACGAALSLGIGRLVNDTTSGQTPMSNFSYTLYGLAVGGKGWVQVLVDHPGATEGAEIYALALEEIRRHPRGLLDGALRMWRAYLWPNEPVHAFAFVGDGTFSKAWRLACMAFALIGFALMLRRRAHPDVVLVAAVAGHLASIPLVPPIDAGLRVYAATMPAIAVLVAVGAEVVLRSATGLLTRLSGTTGAAGPAPVEPDRWPRAAEAFGLSLTAMVFGGPLLVIATSRPAVLSAVACPDGSEALHVRVSNGAFLRIEKTGDGASDARVSGVEVHQQRLALSTSITELRNDAHRFTAGHTMLNGYALESGRSVWLVAPTHLLSGTPGVFAACGHPSDDALSRNYGVFFASHVGPAEHASRGGR